MYSDIKIFENFLSDEEFSIAKKTIVDDIFPWYLVKTTADEIGYKNSADGEFFSHMIYCTKAGVSFYYDSLKFISDKIRLQIPQESSLVRFRANTSIQDAKCKDGMHRPPHTDMEVEKGGGVTAILYLDDSDGDTMFFVDEDTTNPSIRVSPKANRLVMFDTSILHSGDVPRVKTTRALLNFNYVLN